MNYIYDILSNFQSCYYDFFEWNKDDEVIRIRKIPIIKVSNEVYQDFKYNKVKVNGELLNYIEHKTEIFKDRGIDTILYSCIFTNGKESMVLKFDNKGYNVYKSAMIIDEEREVLEDIEREKIATINYELVLKNDINFVTRKEEKIINKVTKDINKLYENEEYDKLAYLYFECFNIKNDNYLQIKKDLIKNLDNKKTVDKISDFIKLISKV